MSLPAIRPDILLSLCEAIEDSPLGGMVIGRIVTSNKFIRPILRYMTSEWKKVKELIVDMIVGMASKSTSKVESIGTLMLEAEFGGVFFKPEDVEAIRANMDHIMGQYKAGVLGQLDTHMANARASTVPIVKIGTSKLTSVALSREGIEEIVDNFTFQKDFVDKLALDTVTRVERLTASRYTSLTDLRGNLNREFRIDRDRGIQSFRNTTDKLANRVRSGRLSSGDFQIQMSKDIEDHYRKLYRAGKGSSLEAWEEEFVRRQAQGQMKYLDNFANYIEVQKGVGNELTSRINQRTSLYAERGSAMYEAGFVAGLPDDVLIDWVLQPAEHCPTCPIYAANSPYTKGTLPGFPGEGFHITICGTNCKCKLRISDLFVIELPGEEEIPDLPISITGERERIVYNREERIAPLRRVGKHKPPKIITSQVAEGGTDFTEYRFNNARIFIEDGVDEEVAKKIADAMASVPEEHLQRRYRIRPDGTQRRNQNVKVYSFKGRSTASEFGNADSLEGVLSIFKSESALQNVEGTVLHEMGHMAGHSFSSYETTEEFLPKGFLNVLTVDGKDVTGYGTLDRASEAFPEAYAKYYSRGEVNAENNGVRLDAITNWFRSAEGFGPGNPSGKTEWMLNL